ERAVFGGKLRRRLAAVADHRGAADPAGVDARNQRIGAEPVRAVVLVLDLARGVEPGHVGRLAPRRRFVERAVNLVRNVVDPEPSHRVVHPGKDLHRDLARVVAYELLVDLEDPSEPDVELLLRNVGQVEVDLAPASHAVPRKADLEYLAGRD